jgi:hypothetical protein
MVQMSLLVARPQRALETPRFQEWTLPGGRPWTQFHRTADGVLLRFPDFADYELDFDGQDVRCIPVPGVSMHTVRHLYHNQVLPLALSRQGKLVFHASAVRIGAAAVAFMGASGKGKSTLAASLAANGYPFLTDDGLLLERSGQQWLAMPSQPSIRLWEDSRQALVGDNAEAAPALEFTSKGRFLASPALQHCVEPHPLTHIYILGDGTAAVPVFETISSSDAVIELVKHSFLLDIEERLMLAAHLDELSALLARISCVSFDFPRVFDALGLVRDSLLADVSNRGAHEFVR